MNRKVSSVLSWLYPLIMLSFYSSRITHSFSTTAKIHSHSIMSTTALNLSDKAAETKTPASETEKYLQTYFPTFTKFLMSKNPEILKILRSTEENKQFTIFAPSENVFYNELTPKQMTQLQDVRNLETVEKIAAFHVVPNEAVSKDTLYNSGGVVTLGGVVPIEQSNGGGFFGIFGGGGGGGGNQEATLNGSRIVNSYEMADGIIHEVDGLVSSQMLWRYMDQLRIPGSQ